MPPRWAAARSSRATLRPSRWAQFMTRLRVEVRQVLTSPGLIVLSLLAIGFTGAVLWLGQSTYGTSDHPTVPATITRRRAAASTIFLLMIAVFYGGELVWRERDRKFNEILDSTPVPSWVMTVPKIFAIFLVLLVVNLVGMATGLFYQMVEGAPRFGIPQYLGWFIIPAAIDGLLIAILAVVVQVLSPNKYVGWGIIFVWFVGRIFLSNMGYSNPLYNYGTTPNVPLSDFNGAGSFWMGAAVAAILLAVLRADPGRAGAFAVAARHRSRTCACGLRRMPASCDRGCRSRSPAWPRSRWRRPGPTPITTSRSSTATRPPTRRRNSAPTMSANISNTRICRSRSITKVTLDVQLYPKERRLMVDGRYDLRNDTGAPIRDVHVRQGDQDTEFLQA